MTAAGAQKKPMVVHGRAQPSRIPLFPLAGAILLPGGQLRLNIFEPRYLRMIDEALAGPRIIGMIQPREESEGGAPPALYGGYLSDPNGFYTSDQRLSAFGGITGGLKLSKAFAGGWVMDGKAEYYEQRADWRLGGEGSPGLDTFKAQFYQVGVTKRF